MKNNIKLVALAFAFFIVSSNNLIAQNPKWSRNGDNLSNGDWLGSTNNEPLLLKANNNLGIRIKTNGELIFKSLDLNSNSGPNGLVFTDGQGLISRFNFSGNSADYLLGNGTWGTLPVVPSSWSVIGNHIFSSNSGNVGIGTSNPLYKLDVIGDVRVSNNLYVGGGIIITDEVNATDQVNTGALTADTINISAGGVITGTASFNGEIRGADKLTVNGNATFSSNVTVAGNSTFINDVTVGNNLTIGSATSDFQMSYVPGGNPSIPNSFIYGKLNNLPPVVISTCNPEYYVAPPTVNQFGNLIRLYNMAANNTYVNGTTFLDIGSNVNAAYVNSVFSPLFINGDCGKDIYLMGSKIGFGTSAPTEKFHFRQGNILLDNSVFANPTNQPGFKIIAGVHQAAYFETNHTYDLGINTVISVNRSTTKALTMINTNPSVTGEYLALWGDGRTYIGKNLFHGNGSMLTVGQPNKNDLALSLVDNTNSTPNDFFNVYGNGYTEIKVYSPSTMPQPLGGSPRAFAIRDMANNKDLFVVNSTGKTYAREVEISLIATFPDYVFDKNYDLKPIEEVEKYISENKHLPGFEKAEYYEKNGINVNDMFIKQQEKIEELTLYIIELKKELDNIKKSK